MTIDKRRSDEVARGSAVDEERGWLRGEEAAQLDER
jgi:hypothetical protein